ncbi:hypothetical protein HNP84_009938 [Thermocatellispora tengchongensis]|uniref:Uncharacterized protein n=1 Tax=Thermocatellispora tengchongensis TaxID=1073253 RepID=A0A840PQX7_9ACTN|nr:hypothetical protein [Thermocatellispora tengchongensis]MBB5140171.1 hypothetical protein [Thermocatellispora tengchongensis]
MTPDHATQRPDEERRDYPEEVRASVLATLREIMGGEPPADALRLAAERDAEFERTRPHAA